MEQSEVSLSLPSKSGSSGPSQVEVNLEKPVSVVRAPSRAKVPKRVRHAKAIEKAELFAAKNLAKYLAKLHELAMGVYLEGYDKENGEMIIYKTKPDLAALKALVERGMGKVVEQVEITGGEDNAVVVMPWRILTQKEITETYGS